MSALYYALGFIARLNTGMWRYRLNFIPINVLVIGLMIFGAVAAVRSAIEGASNDRVPLAVTVAQIRDEANPTRTYISVSGLEIPDAVYEYGEKASNGDITRIEKSWTPLVDRESQRILLVQRAGKAPAGEPRQTTVAGMLRELDDDVRKGLAEHGNAIQGVPVETRYALVDGDTPANSETSAIIAIFLLVTLVLFAIATASRNTVFQRTDFGSPVLKIKSVGPVHVGGTATFALRKNEKIIQKHFIEMPSVLTHTDSGQPVLLSNIDASSHFMGITTSERSGIWTVMMENGSVRDPQMGYLYWGTSRRPALRFTYTSAEANAVRSAIITATEVQMLDTAVAMLTAMPGSQPAGTADPSSPRG